MSEPELKPCPWCGETPSIARYETSGHFWRILCTSDSCEVNPEVFKLGKPNAIAAWNSWGEKKDG